LSSSAEILACFTCGSAQRDAQGRTRGEGLLEALHAARRDLDGGVSIAAVRCLWACSQSCAVHVRAPGKLSYVLARLEPDEDTARDLLAFAALYAQSVDGAVPFKQWPAAVRGHFLCRVPSPAPSPVAPPTAIED
jgi:predicted metal-binding protein